MYLHSYRKPSETVLIEIRAIARLRLVGLFFIRTRGVSRALSFFLRDATKTVCGQSGLIGDAKNRKSFGAEAGLSSQAENGLIVIVFHLRPHQSNCYSTLIDKGTFSHTTNLKSALLETW